MAAAAATETGGGGGRRVGAGDAEKSVQSALTTLRLMSESCDWLAAAAALPEDGRAAVRRVRGNDAGR